MFCHMCGTKISEGATFCHNCGTKVDCEHTESQDSDNIKEEMPFSESDSESRQEKCPDQMAADESACEKDSSIEKNESKFDKWWSSCSKAKKTLVVLGALPVGVIVLYAVIAFLKKFGYLLFGIAIVAGFIITLTIGSKEEKMEARKTIIELVVGFAAVCIIAIIIVTKADFFADIIHPGAGVRNAYLSQYSETVTIEDAFSDYFENGKWDTYKESGYSYVIFNGVCEYLGERADIRITFKITGENFIVDNLEINGQTQNNLILASLLSAVYEAY